jgi:lysozyme family protein
MDSYFVPISKIVLADEGVYSNDPRDSGGETKWGIARAKHPEISADAWAKFTQNDALKIYYDQYWTPNRCGEMDWRWALGIFDGAINEGSVIKLAQRALGIKVDGVVGPEVLAGMAHSSDEQFALFIAKRLKSYIPLPLFPNDGDGWFKRVANIAYLAGKGPGGNL